jgi:hypothetical protein
MLNQDDTYFNVNKLIQVGLIQDNLSISRNIFLVQKKKADIISIGFSIKVLTVIEPFL